MMHWGGESENFLDAGGWTATNRMVAVAETNIVEGEKVSRAGRAGAGHRNRQVSCGAHPHRLGDL